MRLKILIIIFHLIYGQIVIAQTVAIRGSVVSNESQGSLNGVTVKVGSQVTRTDKNGYFEINVSLKRVTELGIGFSHIGYLSINLIYQPNHVYKVQLTENSTGLREVLIAPGDDIIKKAIKKIPENYSDKPTVIKGILRIQKSRNQSQYFRSDAFLKAYISPYTSNYKTMVEVLSNQLDTVYDKTLKYIRNLGTYNLIDLVDIAHNKELLVKLLKKRKFDYRLVGKQMYNNHKVFVINSILLDTAKKYNRLEATLYIDTASYAFVASNLIYYDIPRFGPFIARKQVAYRVGYERIGEKWYLAEAHSKILAEYKNEEPTSTVSFVRTELDTIKVEKIRYKDAVQEVDDIFLINKPPDKEEWAKYEPLFREAELNGKIERILIEKLDTIKKNNIVAAANYKKPLGRKIYDYIRSDNIRMGWSIYRLPISLVSTIYNIPESISYGTGSYIGLRLYENLFFNYEHMSNFSNKKKIRSAVSTFNLSYNFILPRRERELIFIPFAGYELLNVKFEGDRKNYNTIYFGLRTAYELSHKIALLASSGINPPLKDYTLNTLIIKPTGCNIGFGIMIKL